MGKRNQFKGSEKNDLNGGPIVDPLNSDNAYSDKGLKNARAKRQVGKKKP